LGEGSNTSNISEVLRKNKLGKEKKMKRIFSILFVLVLALSFSLITAVPAGAATTPTINHGTFGGAPYAKVDASAVAAYKTEAASISAGGYVSDIEYHTMEAMLISFDHGSTYATDRGGCIYIQTVITGLEAGDIVEVDNDYLYDDGSGYYSYLDQAPYWVKVGNYTHTAVDTIYNWLIYGEAAGGGEYTFVIGSGEYNLAYNTDDLTTIIGDSFKLTRDVKVYRGETLSHPVTSSRGYTTSTSENTSGWSTPIATGSLDTGDLRYVGVQDTYVDDDWVGSSNGDIVGGHIFGQDAFDTIQKGIDGTASGGTVNVAAGTYDEQVVIDKSLTLQGAGDATVIQPSSAAKLTTVLDGLFWYGGTKNIAGIIVANVTDGSSVTIKNLKVDESLVTTKPSGADYLAGIFYRETGGTVDTVTVAGTGVWSGSDRAYGMYLSAGTNTVSVEITGSTITNFDKNGIEVMGNTLTANINHNTITGRGSITDEVQNGVNVGRDAVATVNYNTISNLISQPETYWAAGILFYHYVSPTGKSATANNNIITNCQIGIIFKNANGSAQGNTVSGGTVGLIGIYSEPDLPGAWTASFVGNTINGVKDSPGYENAAIGANTYDSGATLDVTIQGNQLPGGGATNADGISIGVGGADGSIVATITNNTISGWHHDIRALDTDSIVIVDNTISDFIKSGILVEDVLSVQIEGNTISSTDHSQATNGIQIGYIGTTTGTTGTVEGNQINGCHWSGYDPATETYEDDWTASGILVIDDNSALEISDNEVQDCDVGMDIESGTPTTITGNDVHGNSYGFVLWNAAPTINYNNIYQNGLCGVYRAADGDPTGTVDATLNWWGHASGPSGVGFGTGDAVSANVTYSPWLDATYPGGEPISFVGSKQGPVTNGSLNATAEADTEVVVTGSANVTAAEYSGNPGSGFTADIGKYIDVHIDSAAGVTQLEIRLYYTDAEVAGRDEATLRLSWWNGSAWVPCSNSGVNTASNYMWAIITSATTPSLADLVGTPFGGTGAGAPTVTTQAATGVGRYYATLHMDYTVGVGPVQVCFAYKKSADTAWSYTAWVSKTVAGTYAVSLEDLVPNTEYNFKAQLKYIDTVTDGDTLHFLIPASPSGCFIATAAYGTPTAEQINVLREFRDDVLLKSTMGSQFVSLYYQISPPIANFIAGHEVLRTLVRELLVDPIVRVVKATGDIWRN
jgi:parallel beta-helix repeat protein